MPGKGTIISVWFAGLTTLAAGMASAQVTELPLTADRCSIYLALTGKTSPGCPPLTRRLGAQKGVDAEQPMRDVIPPDSDNTGSGYFIRFDFDSKDLTDAYQSHLNRLAEVLKSPGVAGACLKINGHTDSVGAAPYNLSLSDRRATQVAAYLVAKGGASPANVLIRALGETDHLPDYPSNHAMQRRVEILAKAPVDGSCENGS